MRKETIDVPLSQGLDTRTDTRVVTAPYLRVCKNAVFTETGGIQKRKPRTALPTATSDGGTIGGIEDPIRRLVSYEGELLAITKKHIYSYSEKLKTWYQTAEYLAPHVEEESVLIDNTEQVNGNCATLNGVSVFTWTAETDVNSDNNIAMYAALDSCTGTILVQPTPIFDQQGWVNPRAVATDNKIVVFVSRPAVNSFYSMVLSPDEPDLSPTSVGFITAGGADHYDVLADGTRVLFTLAGTTLSAPSDDYIVGSVDENNLSTFEVKPRASGGPCSITRRTDEDGFNIVHTTLAFVGGTAFLDKLNPDFSDDVVALDLFLGAGSMPISVEAVAAYGDDEGDTFVLISEGTTSLQGAATWEAIVNPDGTSGTGINTPNLVTPGIVTYPNLQPASRAFQYDGDSYIWMVFAENSTVRGDTVESTFQTQSSYFLMRLTGEVSPMLVASAVKDAAGTDGTNLTNVQDLGEGSFSFCGIERRRAGQFYAGRGLRNIKFSFDSNEARRSDTLGKTLYLSGGQLAQYDGVGVTEVNFQVYPWNITAEPVNTGTFSVGEGTYSWISSYRWDNAKGESDRSTTASFAVRELESGDSADVTLNYLPITLKQSANGGGRIDPTVECFRTVKNAGLDSPFHLATSNDPVSADYIENDPSGGSIVFRDNLPDGGLSQAETFREGPGVLSSVAPPGATIVEAGDDRLFISGIPNQPHTVWYSKLRLVDEVAAFNEALVITLPPDGGCITDLKFINNTLIVFKETGIYAVPGQGFNNLGQGSNYGPIQVLSTDVGAIKSEVVARIPNGIFFLSQKGWHILDRGWNVQFIGAPVDDFNDDDYTAVHIAENDHEVRCISAQRILLFDTFAQQWSEWTHENPVHHAVLHKGRYYLAGDDTVYVEDEEHGNPTNYSLQVETSWLRLRGLSHFQRIRYVTLLGEWATDHGLLIELARDYDDKCYFQVKEHVRCLEAGDPYQVRHSPTIQKVQALKIRITDVESGSGDINLPPPGEGLKLTGLTLEVSVKPGTARIGRDKKQ